MGHKYYIDTEFLEGTQKEKFPISLFRKNTPPTIDLISIALVSEDNREYYAISKDFNLKEAWNRWQHSENLISGKNQQGKEYWIRENVLKPVWEELVKEHNQKVSRLGLTISRKDESKFNFKVLKELLNTYGKTNKQIAEEVKIFVANRGDNKTEQWILEYEYNRYNPEFYGYYSDYDWVVFAWLFGKMIDLPSGFPKYCRDLKQILDEKYPNGIFKLSSEINGKKEIPVKNHFMFPKQTNSHNALADARWNKELHEFLNKL
jgi:hypothetical protein